MFNFWYILASFFRFMLRLLQNLFLLQFKCEINKKKEKRENLKLFSSKRKCRHNGFFLLFFFFFQILRTKFYWLLHFFLWERHECTLTENILAHSFISRILFSRIQNCCLNISLFLLICMYIQRTSQFFFEVMKIMQGRLFVYTFLIFIFF